MRRAVLTFIRMALSLAVAGCSDARALRYGPAELSEDNLAPHGVVGTILYDDSSLALPTHVAVVEDKVVVLDAVADCAIRVLDRSGGRPLTCLGARGAGPGEFDSPWSLDVAHRAAHSVWVYDFQLARLTLVDLEADAVSPNQHIINLRAEGVLTGPVWVDGGKLLSLGFAPVGRLAAFDSLGEQVNTFGKLPAGPDNVPPGVRQHAYQATLVAHPERHLLAAVTRHASQLEIYRSDGTTVGIFQGPLTVTPHYSVRRTATGSGLVSGADLRFGYVDATASDQYLFALFSGRTREGFPGEAYLGRYVHLFEWTGVFVVALRLDAAVIAIAVDREEQTLYGIRHHPHPAVIGYDIADVLAQYR